MRTACWLFGAWTIACGSNRPEVPADLGTLETCVRLGYPDGPFGTEPGDVAKNVCLEGWIEPDRVERVEETLAPIALSDFRAADVEGGAELLLINTAALWCSACRIEHQTLPEHAAKLAPSGLVVLTALFQGVDGDPATFDDLKLWVENYGTNFPIMLDPSYSFGAYARADTAPLNLVVDAKTMRILKKYIGDQSAVIWPFVEAELARRR